MTQEKKQAKGAAYEPLTPIMCVRLAAPHTWPGPSVLPSVFTGVYCLYFGYGFWWPIWCLLLAVAVFAQAAVNTLNDWADYRAGTDTVENSDDPTDAVLVYNNPNPRHVFALGIAYMLVALVCGLICVAWSGSALPLFCGALGALFIVCYSSGSLPISYLPLGELVSGVVMGWLIPVAGVCVFAAHSLHANAYSFSLALPMSASEFCLLLLAALPFVIGIGMVMATQNNCDIERDEAVGRKTLPVLLGRKRSRLLYRFFEIVWIALVLHLAFWYFNAGFWATLVLLILGSGSIEKVLVSPLVHEVRGPAMGNINKVNLFINGAYILAIMVALF